MSASERSDPKAGPFVNLSQTYCNGLDVLAKGYEPALKGVGRWNLEVMGFMTRRAQRVAGHSGACQPVQDPAGPGAGADCSSGKPQRTTTARACSA